MLSGNETLPLSVGRSQESHGEKWVELVPCPGVSSVEGAQMGAPCLHSPVGTQVPLEFGIHGGPRNLGSDLAATYQQGDLTNALRAPLPQL